MVSFVSYLMQFKDADSAIGDVARDMFADEEIKRVWGYKRLMKHLEEKRACERVYKLVEIAKFAYDTNPNHCDSE